MGEIGEVAFKLLSLPLYMVEQLPRLFQELTATTRGK
jgi:hypothetical protein